jgi:branched-chain amino acid transport system ATP-binding protein
VAELLQSDTILECRGVGKSYGGLRAVSDVSLSVRRGEILGIIGPNGAGKTTLFSVISGHVPASTGTIILNSVDVTRKPAYVRARMGMGRTFQIVRPIPSLTVLEDVMIGAFAAYRSRDAAARRAVDVLDQVELSDRAGAMAGDLTLAGRKRLEIARALAGNTQILLLDEVMAGLNPSEANRAIAMIHRLRDSGVSIVLIEHNLKVVNELAQNVVVLDHGAEIAQGKPAEVLSNPDVIRAYLGNRKVAK